MSQFIKINSRKISVDYPPYIIAEMSANHNRSIDNAFKIIDIAKVSGADAVKLQTYHPVDQHHIHQILKLLDFV